MGNIEQPDGTLVFTDEADPLDDLIRSHSYAQRFAMYRDGTRAQRENLPIPQRRNGMRWFETDTWSEWRLINNEWRQTNSLQSRFRSTAMDITNSQSRMDWNGSGASFGVPDFDYSGGAFTCVQPGVFQITGQIVALPNAGRVPFVIILYKNGTIIYRSPNITAAEGSVSATIATAVECRSGDGLAFDVFATSTIKVDVASGMNVLNIARVG